MGAKNQLHGRLVKQAGTMAHEPHRGNGLDADGDRTADVRRCMSVKAFRNADRHAPFTCPASSILTATPAHPHGQCHAVLSRSVFSVLNRR